MKVVRNILWITAFMVISICSCIKEDMSNCPRGIYLTFECINPKYVFGEIANQLELFFYRSDGTLVYKYTYTRSQLTTLNWKINIREPRPEKYTIIAHVNYFVEQMEVGGQEQQETFQSKINYDEERKVDYEMADTYYGKCEVDRTTSSRAVNHKIMLSKNTNLIDLTLFFENESEYRKVIDIESYVSGSNAIYQWDNTALPHPPICYLPLIQQWKEENRSCFNHHKTLRIWLEGDLKLQTNIIADQLYTYIIDIPKVLKNIEKNGVYPYNSNQKLEYYDHFTFEIIIGTGYVIKGVKVNNWYLIESGQGL